MAACTGGSDSCGGAPAATRPLFPPLLLTLLLSLPSSLTPFPSPSPLSLPLQFEGRQEKYQIRTFDIACTSNYHYIFFYFISIHRKYFYLFFGGRRVGVRGRKPQQCEEELILGSSPRATPQSHFTRLLQGGGDGHTLKGGGPTD